MAITTKESILKVLSAYNPWWKTGTVSPQMSKTYKRFAFHEAMKRLTDKGIRRSVVLTGTRRVGKTTIQYQMIEALLKSGVAPQKIVFISLDHPMLKLSQFQDVLECYHENIYAEQDAYYFFDEVQYAQDWDRWLKIIYDTQPNTRVVATGSASPALMKGSRESGAGRWTVIQVPTMSFYEYCELLDLDRPNIASDLKVTTLLHKSQIERTQIMMQLSKVQNHFMRYLQVGGFPELALADNDLMAQQIMREDVVDKVLKRDLPSLYNIRNATELERIFLYLCNVSSGIVSIEAITKELNGVSRTTVENYIQYLESANLIYQSWPVDMAGKKVLKARPKIYIADAAIRNAVFRRSGIHRALSHVAHKRRNVRFKGLRRVHTPPQPINAHTAAHTAKHGGKRGAAPCGAARLYGIALVRRSYTCFSSSVFSIQSSRFCVSSSVLAML